MNDSEHSFQKGNRMKKLMIIGLAAVAAADLLAVQGTLNTENESLMGDIRWQPRSKQYVVSIKKGQTTVDRECKRDEVTSLEIPKPQGYDKAVQMVESGSGAAAVAILQKIVDDYAMLQWDKPAGRYLAFAHLAAGNAQKAYDACQKIVSADKEAAYSGDLAPAYWHALLKLGKDDQLDGLLKKAASSGDRGASAAAFVMRGDIIVAKSNDNAERLKDALRDGYLRVVLMYQDPACARERADAMVKAAQCFDKLGQSARAEALRAQAKAL